MDPQELADIKARADEARSILESVPFLQDLLDHDIPHILAEIELLMAQLSEAGKCPHGEFYEGQSCVLCFGDGTEEMLDCKQCDDQTWHRGGKCLRHDRAAPMPYETLKRDLEELRGKLMTPGNGEGTRSARCPHGDYYEDRSCVRCFGDGTEENLDCEQCDDQTWHRGGKCLRHDPTAPKPYQLMKSELEELRGKAQSAEEEWSARVEAAERQLKEIKASRDLMREALEYIKPRLGSLNLGESVAKINRALSAAPAPAPAADKERPAHPGD